MKLLKSKIKKGRKTISGRALLLVLIILVLALTVPENSHPLVFSVVRPLIGGVAAAILLREVKS